MSKLAKVKTQPSKSSKQSRVSSSIEDMDYFLYNSEEDAREVKEILGVDRSSARSYDSSYLNEIY